MGGFSYYSIMSSSRSPNSLVYTSLWVLLIRMPYSASFTPKLNSGSVGSMIPPSAVAIMRTTALNSDGPQPGSWFDEVSVAYSWISSPRLVVLDDDLSRSVDGPADCRFCTEPCNLCFQQQRRCSWTHSKGKGSPCSITKRRVPELIPVLGSQPAGNVSHKPAGRLPLLSARPAVTPATIKSTATSFAVWWTEAQWVWTVCLRLLPDSVAVAIWTRALLRLSPAC